MNASNVSDVFCSYANISATLLCNFLAQPGCGQQLTMYMVAEVNSVQSTLGMCSMLILGGSGGMHPRKILKFMLEEMQSSIILGQF